MLIVLMGAPAAGKTTWLKKNMTGFEHIATSEMVRVDREIDVAAYMNNMRIQGSKALASGKDVIVDATNTITAHRLFWLKQADRYGHEAKLVVFDTDLALLLNGQKVRVHPAPRDVVIKHHKNMKLAMQLIKNEGWDDIIIQTRRSEQGFH